MSLEPLQNALCRDLQAAEQPVYDRRSLSCRYQHVRLQGLKRKCFPHAQSAETIRNRERFDRKMGKNIVHKDMRFVPAPCSPVILHPCDPAPLRPYTLHLTFSSFHFAVLDFSQSSGRYHKTMQACTVEITQYALKGQKRIAQGVALGNYERQPVAL